MKDDYKNKLASKIAARYQDLEERIMKDIVRRIVKAGEITSTADWQINRLRILGYSSEDIEREIKKTLNASYPEMFELYDKVIEKEYIRDKDVYEQINAEYIPFEGNGQLKQITEAIIDQSFDDLENVTNSLGFYLDYGNGKKVLTPLSQANRVDVAARRAVMTAVSQITGKISEYNAQKLGTEYFEVEWHAGARPTHAVWQGRVWSKEQLYSVCGLGTVTGLLGVNCYHTYYPFFPGLSERNWTDEWLDAKNLEESEPKNFGDKEYTLYEAKQKQRQMELAMRAQREKVRLLQKGKADPDEILLHKAKYQGQLNEYSRFCRKMKLTEERERIYLDMKGRVATNSKRQNALFPREMIENASKDVAQYKRYKEVLGDYIGSLVNFGQMKYNDSEKWKIISEAYIDVKWQSQALKKKQIGEVHSIPYKGAPNSVFDNFKDGALQRRRYYGNDGRPRLDIDMTDHGNSKEHPIVPHYHNWYLDEKGNLKREAKHDNPLKLGHEIANKDILEKR